MRQRTFKKKLHKKIKTHTHTHTYWNTEIKDANYMGALCDRTLTWKTKTLINQFHQRLKPLNYVGWHQWLPVLVHSNQKRYKNFALHLLSNQYIITVAVCWKSIPPRLINSYAWRTWEFNIFVTVLQWQDWQECLLRGKLSQNSLLWNHIINHVSVQRVY